MREVNRVMEDNNTLRGELAQEKLDSNETVKYVLSRVNQWRYKYEIAHLAMREIIAVQERLRDLDVRGLAYIWPADRLHRYLRTCADHLEDILAYHGM